MPRPSSSWTSYCPSGARWRTLPSGLIEVEGMGIPVTAPVCLGNKPVAQVWQEWQGPIERYSAKYGLPAVWTLAILCVETCGKNYAPNSAGAGGLMALLPQTAAHVLGRPANIMDTEVAFDAGCGWMREVGTTYAWELPVIAAGYNAGSPKCSTSSRCKDTIDGSWTFDGTSAPNPLGMVEDCTGGRSSAYSLKAVMYNNVAIQLGLVGSGLGRPLARVAMLGLGTAGLLLLHRRYGAEARALAGFLPQARPKNLRGPGGLCHVG